MSGGVLWFGSLGSFLIVNTRFQQKCCAQRGLRHNRVRLSRVSILYIKNPLYGGNFLVEAGAPLPFVLPGEEVEPDPLRILEPSPQRVAPGCVHFGLCGGCQYQHAAYPFQMELKAELLAGILRDAGLSDLPAIETTHAGEWHYRNRIRLRVEPTSDGYRLGYSRRASNEFLPIRMCPIAASLLWRAAEALLAVGDTLLATISEVELLTTADESRLQLQFFLRQPLTSNALFTAACERLQHQVPELAGAGAELDPELNRRVRRRWAGLTWGAPGLNYEAAGRTYWVSRGAFFQVNRLLVDRLLELVCRDFAGKLAWDLFAGVGLFTRELVGRFEQVVAVEAGDAAAADLLAASRGGRAFETVHAATLDFLRARELQRERPELIVLDPPRAGLGAEGSAVLARIAAPRLVYVSCDPVTLARDLAILTRTYVIETLDLIDLFPQTFHMETVVRLTRR
jgi:23S rRNA (uracil1939-C5)-methyltransferase